MTRRRERSDFSSSFPKYVCALPRESQSARSERILAFLSHLFRLFRKMSHLGMRRLTFEMSRRWGCTSISPRGNPLFIFNPSEIRKFAPTSKARRKHTERPNYVISEKREGVRFKWVHMWLSRVFYERASSETFVHSVALRRARITEEGKNKEFIV